MQGIYVEVLYNLWIFFLELSFFQIPELRNSYLAVGTCMLDCWMPKYFTVSKGAWRDIWSKMPILDFHPCTTIAIIKQRHICEYCINSLRESCIHTWLLQPQRTFVSCIHTSWKCSTLFITDMFYNHNKNTSHLFPFNSNALRMLQWLLSYSSVSINQPLPSVLFIVSSKVPLSRR